MLVNCDVKGLEVVVAGELSQDPVLCQEIRDKVDIHDANRVRFGLGEGKLGRLIAKIFKFRLIYGGSAYSYAHDPDFTRVSSSIQFWEKVIDEYYTKYKGVKKWHDNLLDRAKRDGCIEIPSGRYFEFSPKKTGYGYQWPETTIKNYPVQGFGADLVMLARIDFWKNLKDSGLEALFIQTVHDSLVVDTPSKNVYTISQMLQDSVARIPDLCREHFDYDFSLPMTSEVMVGPNKKDLKEYNAS